MSIQEGAAGYRPAALGAQSTIPPLLILPVLSAPLVFSQHFDYNAKR